MCESRDRPGAFEATADALPAPGRPALFDPAQWQGAGYRAWTGEGTVRFAVTNPDTAFRVDPVPLY